jgi:hypothetical protein
MASDELSADEIDVSPTRALFVEMLTRDIALNRAILDLVDNSVDGAKRIRQGEDPDFTGLEIKLRLSNELFEICDNCGGIGIDVAKHYAFRFGKAPGAQATPGSVGQFGVGMKRALFKFGHSFEVISATQVDRFELRVDVDAWEQQPGPWRFAFERVEHDLDLPASERGTEVRVRSLRADAAAQFSSRTFQNNLIREIEAAQQVYIDRGLRIVVNDSSLIATSWKLTSGAGIEPMYAEEEITIPEGGLVKRRIFAGVAESSPQAAGWYVFCNGRMILQADQTKITGWERGSDEESVVLPKFHGQFARFRGYVFFDSQDASLLPWNTTKTGVDVDADLWRNTYQALRSAMRPIIDFLNKLASEADAAVDQRPMTDAIKRAVPVPLRRVAPRASFVAPRPPSGPRPPPWTSIQFSRPKDKVDALKSAYDVHTNSSLGETLFDLAYAEHGGS